MLSLNWTDQGIRAVKDSPKRSEDARELAKKVGVEIKHLYLTSGDTDLIIFVDAPSGDNVAKFTLALTRLANWWFAALVDDTIGREEVWPEACHNPQARAHKWAATL